MKTVFRFTMVTAFLCAIVHAQTTVSAVSPANHALNVSAATAVQITFSSAMLAGSFNDTTSFIVNGMTSGRHRGTFILSGGNTVATFTPTAAFARGEIVTVDLTSNLQDSDSTAITPFVFSFTVNVDRASGTYATKVDYPTTSKEVGYAGALFVHDIDGDADGDIIATNEHVQNFEDLEKTSDIVKMVNNGAGIFVRSNVYSTEPSSFNAPSIISILGSDIDKDGDGDVVLAIAEVGYNRVSILKNNGDGTFAAINSVITFVNPIASIFVSDIDGDGDEDIAVGRYSSTVSILKNNGDGTFAAKVDYSTGSNDAYSVFISDLDGDGDGDIAIADYDTTSGNISVLKNNSDGTFSTAVDYTTGNQPYRLFIGDVDGDGDGDIVTANSSSHSVSVLKNNGNGTFATNVDYTTAGGAHDVFIGDVDGDGDGDIVVGNVGVTKVSVLKNNGNGTFAPKADFATGGPASSVFMSDVNGDGIADIVAANNSAHTVSVLMGQPGPSATTDNATNVSVTTATVNGTVNANNATTTVRFVYGTTSGIYTDSVTAAESPVSGTSSTPVSALRSGLSGNTTYYFRVAASNADGYARGGEVSFTTTSGSPSTVTTAATNVGMTTARMNGTVNANGASTTVRFLYGTTSGIYTDSVTATQSPVSGTVNTAVEGLLSSLDSNVTYYFRVAASNVNGYVRGSELSFTTDSISYASGYALQFDGVDDYVTMGNKSAFNVGTALTYEAWINPYTSHNGWIIAKWQNFVEDKQLVFYGDRVYFYLFNVFGGTAFGSSSTIPFNQLTHIAATYNGSVAKIYINGVLDTSKSVGSGAGNGSGNLFIGANPDRASQNSVNPFNGIIDEVRIWNTARTESEIQSAMNTPLSGDETGLVAYWNFDEGIGTSTADISSNNNDGSISGATWVASAVALPVELASFTTSIKNDGVELQWSTATEVNNFGFDVERSKIQKSEVGSRTSGETWRNVGFVEGSGTTNSPKQYSFADKNLPPGRYFYRLKQTDRDGKFTYSQSVEVTMASAPKEFALGQNYPNPFNPSTVIRYQLPVNGHVSLKVYDAIGRDVATLADEWKEAGYYFATFEAARLSSGIYFVRLESNGKQALKKMILMK
ncbi:MAG: FG-GAP-like repeat-containing protein [Bacteroidota bacterium]|jgi:hypothetical protein